MRSTLQKFLAPLICILFLSANSWAQFQFISPLPGSKFHNPSTNIILRNGNLMDESSIHTKNLFRVEGSQSGTHEYGVKLGDGGKVVILQPDVPFTEGERVTVTVADGMKTKTGDGVKGTSFSFEIHPPRTPEQQQEIKDGLAKVYQDEFGSAAMDPQGDIREEGKAGIPDLTILANNNPAPGVVLFHNFNFYANLDPHYCIIQSNGDSVFGKADSVTFNNFLLNHSGYLTVYNKVDSVFLVLDSSYNKVGELQMGNGYRADVHECQMFKDKLFLLDYDPQIVDMTVYNPNYSPNALVIGCVLQELDNDFNVVFEWRSWDHFEITDATHVVFTASPIDYVHANSMELDNDGNLLLSCRHMDEVTKINLTTGDIIWRLGGIHNQFTFINDAEKFSHQHDVRRIANGNLTLFDNGNFHVPPRSYAKEYHLDEVNKTATLVWSYNRVVASGNVFASAMGSVQRLDNGNTFICWGLIYGLDFPNVTEVDPSNNVVWEMKLNNNDGIYRATRRVWDPCARPTPKLIKAKGITNNSAKISWAPATGATKYNIEYKPITSSTWADVNSVKANKKLTGLSASTKYQVRVRSFCSGIGGIYSAWSVKQFITAPLKPALTEETTLTSFTVYPNPGNGSVHFDLNLNDDEDVTINVFDLSGKLMYTSMNHLLGGEQSLMVNLDHLPSGIYFAEVKTGESSMIRKLVIE